MLYNKDMKFKYKFSKTVYVFFALAYLAAAGCLIWNAIRFVGFVKEGIEIPLFDYISFLLILDLKILFYLFFHYFYYLLYIFLKILFFHLLI